jgi:signal recognition particle receptor subunit beta
MLINYVTREMTVKIVYYGPPFCGKTTNLMSIHGCVEGSGKMISLFGETDQTLFFDLKPPAKRTVSQHDLRLQIYTVPGEVKNNTTLRLVLKGADAVVFVADSAQTRMEANRESLDSLVGNLRANGDELSDISIVVQFNKRDVPDALPLQTLRTQLDLLAHPFTESVAILDNGVMETLDLVTDSVVERLTAKRMVMIDPSESTRNVVTYEIAAPAPAIGFSFDEHFAHEVPSMAIFDTPFTATEAAGGLAEAQLPVAILAKEFERMTGRETILVKRIVTKVSPVRDRAAMERRMRTGLSFRSWILNHRVGNPWRVQYMCFSHAFDDEAVVRFSIDDFVQPVRANDEILFLLALYPSGAVRGVSAEISSVNDKVEVELVDPLALIDPEDPDIWPMRGRTLVGELELIALRGAL